MDSAHSLLQDRGRSRDTRPCCVQVEICRPTVTGMEVQGDGTVAKKRERPKQTEAGAGWELFTQSAGSIPQHSHQDCQSGSGFPRELPDQDPCHPTQ